MAIHYKMKKEKTKEEKLFDEMEIRIAERDFSGIGKVPGKQSYSKC